MCTEGRPWTAGVRAWVAVLCCCLPSLVLAVPLPDLGASGAGELTLTSDEQAYLQAKGRITYCPDPAWMPLESIQDGVHVGMTRDYVDYVQGLLGVPFELVVSASWSEAIEHARNRVCDVWPLAMPTPERLTYMRFTQPYMNIPLVVSTRAQALFFTDIAQLAGKPLGVSKGYSFAELLRRNHPELQLVDVDNVADGLARVARGDLFGMIDTLATVGYHIQRDYLGELVIAGKFDERWVMGMAVRSDEPLLVSILDKALAALPPDAHDRILTRWVSVSYQSVFERKWVWQGALALLVLLLFVAYRYWLLADHNHLLRHLSQTDKLTGLYNRQKLDEVLGRAVTLAQRYGRPLSVVMLDIDHFKQVNDEHGHLVGDGVLQAVAELLRQHVRASDLCGRWGGEEFLIVCPETDSSGALQLAENLRRLIEAHDYATHQPQSASFGVASWQASDTAHSLVKRADDALYLAKDSGRNRVCTELSLSA